MWEQELIAALPSPCYLVDEDALKLNLEVLGSLRARAGCKVLLALKSFALWRLAPLISQDLDGVNAASLHEARLGLEEFGKEVHLTPVALGPGDFAALLKLAPGPGFHLVFNTLSQWRRFGREAVRAGIKCGLRVNPERSVVKVPIYDPCGPGSRLGITAAELAACDPAELAGVSGLHFHALCEQNADALGEVLGAFEEKFGRYLSRMSWVNFGGGHHITRLARLHPELGITEDYEFEVLVKLLQDFQARWPLQIYLEPGEAIALGAGGLIATVLDIIPRDLPIALLDASAAAHMPDVIEMPYQPPVLAAIPAQPAEPGAVPAHTYRLAGNTCLAGDVIGDYTFAAPLAVGSRVVFLDQAHYTMVKNNTFNGVNLPAIALKRSDGRLEIIREFGYEDYKTRLA